MFTSYTYETREYVPCELVLYFDSREGLEMRRVIDGDGREMVVVRTVENCF